MKMKLFILFVITTNVLFSEIISTSYTNNAIENLYIDVLVQRYITMESDLWLYIYSGAKTKDIIYKIRTDHHQFLSNRGLAAAMSDGNKIKFGMYLDFVPFENYVQEDPIVAELAEQPHRIIGNENYLNSDKAANIYNRIITDDLFIVVKEVAEKQNCDDSTTTTIESASQDLFNFYEVITASLLISYAFAQRLNMLQVVRRGFDHDTGFLRNQFSGRYSKIAELARENIQTSSKIVWKCDMNHYSKDDKSIQITNFLNGYVDNEINLNNAESCWNSCEDYRFTRNYGCSKGTFCDEQRKIGRNAVCNGTIVDCGYIDGNMKICTTTEKDSSRRYEFINYESGRHFGRHYCVPKDRFEVSSWWNIWLMRCQYCFCYCDSPTDSDRYFSLQQAVSTIRKNKIITGVGITKRNGIFSWTIMQSKLLPHGRVQQSSYNYQNESDGDMMSDDDDDDLVYQNFARTDFGITEGVDYHTLSWQNRSINLATITAPPGCVVTGVRFTVIKGHLNIEIRSTQFNFNTGLLYGRSEWISNRNERRSVLLLDQPEPSYPRNFAGSRSIPNFAPNNFIKFRPSDPDKDAGQTTVPFIDPQLVSPKRLTLLSGIGIYYKGLKGYGGFVAPKLIVYDMSSYLGI